MIERTSQLFIYVSERARAREQVTQCKLSFYSMYIYISSSDIHCSNIRNSGKSSSSSSSSSSEYKLIN